MDYSIIDLPRVELLDEETTREYIEAAQNGDKKALETLVEHNLRLVLKITYRFKNRDYDLQDLFQIGVIGLIKAIEAFDLDRNNKFSTYAFSRITGEIRLHLRDDGIINVSRSLKKIAREVKKTEEKLQKEYNRTPTIEELSEETGYSRERILRSLEADKNPTSLFKSTYEEEGSELHLIDNLEDKSENNALSNVDKITLIEILKKLDQRSRKIIYLRYFEDKTQAEIGEELGISQVQVSRLERKIIKELKNEIN